MTPDDPLVPTETVKMKFTDVGELPAPGVVTIRQRRCSQTLNDLCERAQKIISSFELMMWMTGKTSGDLFNDCDKWTKDYLAHKKEASE